MQAGCVSNGVSGNIKAIYNSPVSHVTPDQYYQYVLICRLPGPAPPPAPGYTWRFTPYNEISCPDGAPARTSSNP